MSIQDDSLDVSVIICTRNRAEPLAGLLRSLTSLNRPKDLRWEVVVVDNGSSDSTPDVLQRFAGQLPLQHIREETPGLSNARNRGVDVARGRYICWTDDDVEIDANWLNAYLEAFKRHPDAAVFGGQIEPKLEPPTPPWFAELVGLWPLTDIVAARDFGATPVELDFGKGIVPWGANFAVRAAEQRQHRYDPNLGVSPAQRRSGEEAQVMFEILQGAANGWWVPDSKVYHLSPPHRQSLEYFREHYTAIGESKAYLDDTRAAHFMNRDGQAPRAIHTGATILALRIAANTILFRLFQSIGLTRRSLYHLRRLGLDSGVLAYKRTKADAPSL